MSAPGDAEHPPVMNTREKLEEYLNEMIESPERRTELTLMIAETFTQERAVMVLDMSGFSRTTQRDGIIPFLLMIHQMKLVVRPAVASHRGLLVKEEADNLYCLFDSVADAVAASQEITDRLEVVNLLLPERKRLYVSIGIGFGVLLNIANEDLFGEEINLASKLGEDIAQMGQILLTHAAGNGMQGTLELVEHTLSVSGLSFKYYELVK